MKQAHQAGSAGAVKVVTLTESVCHIIGTNAVGIQPGNDAMDNLQCTTASKAASSVLMNDFCKEIMYFGSQMLHVFPVMLLPAVSLVTRCTVHACAVLAAEPKAWHSRSLL
jgi:hypothetical protein